MPSESTTCWASTRKPCVSPVMMKVSANTIPVPMAAVMKRRRRHCRSRNAVINIRMRACSRSSPMYSAFEEMPPPVRRRRDLGLRVQFFVARKAGSGGDSGGRGWSFGVAGFVIRRLISGDRRPHQATPDQLLRPRPEVAQRDLANLSIPDLTRFGLTCNGSCGVDHRVLPDCVTELGRQLDAAADIH